jgi:dipeptidyl aminopeptidase/acylaminoacyl peptidase
MPELESRLREYAMHLDRMYPDVWPEEIIERDVPVVLGPVFPLRARRPRRISAMTAILALVVLAAGLVTVNILLNRRQASSSGPPSQDLGIYEPIRGWIVYRVGDHLEAVDPADPSSRQTLEVLDAPGAVPAGWSADGSLLALTDEPNSDLYVMDRQGELTRVPVEVPFAMRCCSFVTSAWLSPDGESLAGAHVEGGTLLIVDLDDGEHSRSFEAGFGRRSYGPGPVWSPDASEIAFLVSPGREEQSTVQVIDVETGVVRDLVAPGLGFIRQVAWSPDASQLVVIGGELSTSPSTSNPLASPQPTGIYLVDADGSTPRQIATGYYIAAAWSPDGAQIAAIDFDGDRTVVVMNSDGTDLQVLAELPASDIHSGLAWHPSP